MARSGEIADNVEVISTDTTDQGNHTDATDQNDDIDTTTDQDDHNDTTDTIEQDSKPSSLERLFDSLTFSLVKVSNSELRK